MDRDGKSAARAPKSQIHAIRLIAGAPFHIGRWRKSMQVASKRTAIATLTVACVALLSLSWSEQGGISLGVESAQAGTNRQSTPPGVAGVVRRQHRRSIDHGYGLWAEAVAATTTSRHYDDYYCYGPGRGYPSGYYYRSYPGGLCVSSSHLTGLYAQPTLFPRYYGGWSP
jgi:hypothetical protein